MLAPSACHQLWAESWQTYSSRRPWLKLLSPHAHAHRPCQLNAVVPRLLLSEADTLLEAGYAGVAEACCLVRTPHQGCHESVGLGSWPGQGVDVTSMAQTDGNICVPLRHCFPCHQLQTLLWIYRYSSIQQLLHRVLEPAASPCPSPTGTCLHLLRCSSPLQSAQEKETQGKAPLGAVHISSCIKNQPDW